MTTPEGKGVYFAAFNFLSGFAAAAPAACGQTVTIAGATVWITIKPLPTLAHHLPTSRWRSRVRSASAL